MKPDNQSVLGCLARGPSHPAELSERTIEHSARLSSHIAHTHTGKHNRKQSQTRQGKERLLCKPTVKAVDVMFALCVDMCKTLSLE